MKRSEMVENIADALLKLYGGDEEEREIVRDSTKMNRLRMAHIALQTVEKFDMLPPKRTIEEEKWVENDGVTYKQGKIKNRSWDPE